MSKFMTYVIRMPVSEAARAALSNGVIRSVVTNGGQITGQSPIDHITLSEHLESRLEIWDADEARSEVATISELL
ncbi:hypothetical protein ACIQAL_22260 [Pseudomonas sp. NPDC088368]|uniref:hypothetical protein n=1 Tax=Pseudomonas sp. NPDC088368 TaxID=3364453 RepID=UPI00380D83F6